MKQSIYERKWRGLYLGGIISKLKMYERSLLYYAVFSWKKRLEMLSDEKIEKCNSFLASLFIFCFLNIIIRAFFRDINCTLKKEFFY